ncbi:PRD domain-containing protein [Bacillus sp. SL00103]
MKAIDQKLQLDLAGDAELIGLSLHLKPAMTRCKYGMNLRNPDADEIKAGYPLAFEAGIVASRVIEEETGLCGHENEIGYIALHFGAALEREKMEIRRSDVSLFVHLVQGVRGSAGSIAVTIWVKVDHFRHSRAIPSACLFTCP